MTEFDFLIYDSNRILTIYAGLTRRTIHLRSANPDSTDHLTVFMDNQSYIWQLPAEMDAEGQKIDVRSDALPTGSVIAIKFKPVGMTIDGDPYNWSVQAGGSQPIYVGEDTKVVLIQGPENSLIADNNPKKPKVSISVNVQSDVHHLEGVISGSNMLVNDKSIWVVANWTDNQPSLNGKYVYLK